MKSLAAALLAVAMLAWVPVSEAAIDVHEFQTAEHEARFRALIDELRCPKCLNTNLAGSDSPISADLRATVARMVNEGHTDAEILDYLRSRYGDFILYRPRFTTETAALWLTPLLLLGVGCVVVLRILRVQEAESDEALSEEERARLRDLVPDESVRHDA